MKSTFTSLYGAFSYAVGYVLLWLTSIAGGSLGWAIILFSLLVRILLLPLAIASNKQMKAMQELQPLVKELKRKHKDDTKAFQLAQAELMREQKLNPIMGCIPQLIQLVFLIALNGVFTHIFATGTISGVPIVDLSFLWIPSLAAKDPYYILPVVSAALQFVLSLMMLPKDSFAQPTSPAGQKTALVTSGNKDIKTDDVADMSASMQKQMVFMAPIMTLVMFVILPLSAGLALYWTASTFFTIIQQYFLAGWGGATPFVERWAPKMTQKSTMLTTNSKRKGV